MSTEAPVQAALTPSPAAAAPGVRPSAPSTPSSAEAKAAAARTELAKTFFPKDPTPPAPAADAKPAAVVSGDDAPPAPSIIAKKPAEAKPADAKPADAAPVEGPEDKLPEPKSPEAQAGWKELKAIAKEARNRAAQLERDLLEARKAAPTPNATEAAETAQLKNDLKAAQDRLLTLDLQSHPDFARQFVEPKKKALATATEVLGYNGKESVDPTGILGKPLKDFNAAISEFTKDMNPADAGMVMQSLRQARELHLAEQGALSNSRQVHEQLTAKAVQAQKQAFESVASEVVPSFAKREVVETMSAEEKASVLAYNQSVESLRARAESRAFGRLQEKDVATMAFKEAAFDHLLTHGVPYLESHVASQNKIIAQLTSELKALRGGKAPVVVSTPADGGKGAPEKKTLQQLARETWAQG